MADVVSTDVKSILKEFNIVSGIGKQSGKPWKGFQFVTKGGYSKIFFITDEAVHILQTEFSGSETPKKTILDDDETEL